MAPVPVRAVVFDWDGTLMDSKSAIVATYRAVTAELLGRAHPDTPEEIDHVVQLRAQDAIAELIPDDAALRDSFAARFHEVHVANQAACEPFQGCLELLAALRERGLGIGVATSKARSRMELDADRTGLGRHVDVAVTGDDVELAKPDPASVVAAITALGVAPAEALYVGDGPNDVRAGRAAGARTVGVAYGFHPAEMRAARPDVVVERPVDVLALLTS